MSSGQSLFVPSGRSVRRSGSTSTDPTIAMVTYASPSYRARMAAGRSPGAANHTSPRGSEGKCVPSLPPGLAVHPRLPQPCFSSSALTGLPSAKRTVRPIGVWFTFAGSMPTAVRTVACRSPTVTGSVGSVLALGVGRADHLAAADAAAGQRHAEAGRPVVAAAQPR